MSLLLDLRFVHDLSVHLERFRETGRHTWNFRCPICGDSEVDKRKARGYLFEERRPGHESRLIFKCHNCGRTKSFDGLLKAVDEGLHSRYVMGAMEEKATMRRAIAHLKGEVSPEEPLTREHGDHLRTWKLLAELPSNHPAVVYFKLRMIPESWLAVVGHTDAARANINRHVQTYSDRALSIDYPAIVIPLLTSEGKMFGFQSRIYTEAPQTVPKYQTTILEEGHGRFFGLDRLDRDRPFFVVEGPIDSMFLDNAIAVCGSDMSEFSNDPKATMVLDCEPRNRQIVRKYEKLVEAGARVVFLPSQYSGMDINDLVLSGISPENCESLLIAHARQGLEAEIELANWRRV